MSFVEEQEEENIQVEKFLKDMGFPVVVNAPDWCIDLATQMVLEGWRKQ